MKKKIVLLSLVLATSLLMTGCQNDKTNQNNEGTLTSNTTTSGEVINSGDENKEMINTSVNKYDDVEQNPVVTLEIQDLGIIKMELYPQIAPGSVENFIELVGKGFYDGLIFHRTIPGFMAQGGDPDGNGTGGPGYGIKGEFAINGVENKLSHVRGVLSMARSQANDSAGSQFFITTADATYLDGQYAAFGRVIEGMDVVDKIVNLEVVRREIDEGVDYYTDPEEYIKQSLECDRPINPAVISKATVETFGVEYDAPEKITE